MLSTHPLHLRSVKWSAITQSLGEAIQDVEDHHTIQVSAALSYYFFLALFPGLIVLSVMLSWVPIPNLLGWTLGTLGRLLPPDSMKTLYSVLTGVLTGHRGTWLSIGMVGMIWVTSAAFDALIEALNIAYDIKDNRPFWKTRLLALGLGLICSALFLTGLAVIILGPRFGAWAASRLDIPQSFGMLWRPLHWTIAIVFSVLGVELLYYLAPCKRPRFVTTLPGAILTVVAWLGLSSLLGVYFRHFANYSRVYGTLGGFIAFMTWFQWTSFAMLVGAELNAELAKRRAEENSEAEVRGSQRRLQDAA